MLSSHSDSASLPAKKLPPLLNHGRHNLLPPLGPVTSTRAHHHSQSPQQQQPPLGQLPLKPPTFHGTMAYRQHPFKSGDVPAEIDLDARATIGTTSSPQPPCDAASRSLKALNLDDPDVRMAAEALGDLRADFVTSPPDSTSLPPTSPPAPDSLPISPSSLISKSSSQPEPLLSLLTTSHPLLATTIGGATSAYGEAKNFSPRFKTGAEYVEGYLTPIANTVGSVGRVTGVEGGVRWFLGAGRRHAAPSDPESSTSSCKRRKVGDEADTPAQDGKNHAQAKRHMPDLGQLPSTSSPTPCSPRRLSSTSTIDTLPAYDDHRSPAYTESAGPQNASNPAPASNSPWQSRLIMSTSGLSVSMSAESLRSLRYCLRWLRWTNDHMGRAIGSLKSALEEYERAGISTVPSLEDPRDPGHDETIAPTAPPPDQMPEQSRMEIVAKINSLKGDILKTLQDAIVTVSKYAGGALPENARILVRRHLTSLPQRFRIATMLNNSADGGDRDSESAIREGAQKVLVLAKEGLEMVTQISGVVDGTIVSAEDWCERMGKQRRPAKEGGPLDVSLERSNGGDMKSV